MFKYEIPWKFFNWEQSFCMRTDIRTDVQTGTTKLVVAFRNFAKSPKNGIFIPKPYYICHVTAYVLDCDLLQAAAYDIWNEGNCTSEEFVEFISFFHEKGRTRFVHNFSPSYQRHFPGNRKRDTPTLVRISSLSSLDRFCPHSFLFHVHSYTIQPNKTQHCTLKKVVKYYGEKPTHRSNKPITLSRFLTFASYFHDKVRANKEKCHEAHRDCPMVLAYNYTSDTSIRTEYAFGVPRGAVPRILDVTVAL